LASRPAKPIRRQVIQALARARTPVRAIAHFVQCSVATVRRWTRVRDGDLCDAPRTGRPPVYDEDFRLRMVAFYCQSEPVSGVGRWTLRWAAAQLAVDPARLGGSPSKSTVQRILKGHRLKPHQSRYFLHITDPDFFPKLEHLIELYQNPPRHLYFFDECPGIQILKRLTPDLKSETTAVRLEEFEYIRNGTMDVFAFLDHATGRVYLECQSDHTTDTLLGVFQRHADHCPTHEPMHYVMDNLSSHSAYPFCALVAQLSGIECPSEDVLDTPAKRRA
jgi:transposase